MFGWRIGLGRQGSASSRLLLATIAALDARVMVADAQMRIVYLNAALVDFLRGAETAIRTELPAFQVDKLIGASIDLFHRNPQHQRRLLGALQGKHQAVIPVGGLVFDLVVKPLRRGMRTLGYVVEWADAAARLASFDYAAQIEALGRSQAIIAFTPEGQILTANANFLAVMGYRLDEIAGRSHAIFVDPAYAASPDYDAFWQRLRGGQYQADEFKRFGKNGHEVWIQGSYNPILDEQGRVTKVVKFAVDVTERVDAVGRVGRVLTAIASGDFTHEVDRSLTPELDQLRQDLNRSIAMLRRTLGKVGEVIGAVQTGTREIQISSDDLSRRTEQQAASLQETASALEQITATVQQTATQSRSAQSAVSTATQDARRSGAVVDQTVVAMSAIEQSSAQIEQIIGVIDEIAFQTNLLALNAGVEAARAGEAGRGFAVVASEVRALAQRSAEAAKEIKALIARSGERVSEGVSLVNQTGAALNRIVEQVEQINTIIVAIAASAGEQAAGVGEVNTAIAQMDQMTQQNAAMVEQSTAATHALAAQADDLQALIAPFRFERSGRSRPA